VFGDGWVYNSTPVAFQWTAQTGSTLLPLGRISATNTTGTMIAGFDDVGWPNYYRPYVWSQAQGKQFLPTTGAYNQFVTSAISDTGVIVGSCSDPNAPSGVPFVYAWLWSRDRGTMLVADYVRDVLGLDTTGIYFVNAADITPDGHHILCTIWRPSVGQYSETAIITIPEPATLSLLALAGLAMLKRRSGR
jgi:hypothetical protein